MIFAWRSIFELQLLMILTAAADRHRNCEIE